MNRHPSVISILILTGVIVVTYANSLTNSFHYDDFHGIVRNPIIRDLRNIALYFTDPSTFSLSHYDDWRPILQITYALNFFFGGLNPVHFRVFNLLIHIASAILVYLIADEIGHSLETKPKKIGVSFWPGTTCALIFALHPANSEVVNYIWPRSTLLASCFYLFGFYCYLRTNRDEGLSAHRAWSASMLCSYVLGLGTKATTITLPATLLLYNSLRTGTTPENPPGFQSWATEIRKIIPLMIVGVLYVMLRVIFLPESFTRVVDSQEVSRLTYFLSSMRALVYYLGLYIWPSPLLVNFYGFGWSNSFLDHRVLSALATILLLLGVAWRMRRRQFIVSFFTFWFFIALLPEQSIFPLSEPMNGYRPYLAYAGLSVAIPHAVQTGLLELWTRGMHKIISIESWRLSCWLGSIFLMIILAICTARRNQDWQDEETLWSDVLQKDPNNPRAHMTLGLEFIEQGNYSKAGAMLEKAIRLAPKNSYTHFLRAYFHQLSNRDADALQNLTTAVELNPRSTFAHFYRAELLAKKGAYADAINDYERALKLKHYFTDARFGLAMAYLQQYDLEKGRQNCERILDIDRRDARAYRCLGRIFMEQKDFIKAVRLLRRGLSYVPNQKELWYDVAVAHFAAGSFDQAELAFRRAKELGLNPK